MRNIGNRILNEEGDGFLLMEEADGYVLNEEMGDVDIAINNYLSIKVGDGMSTTEKIR